MIEVVLIMIFAIIIISNVAYKKLEKEVLCKLGFSNWDVVTYFDDVVIVKSRQAVEKYDDIKYFKENKEKLAIAENVIKKKDDVEKRLRDFLKKGEFRKRFHYRKIKKHIKELMENVGGYRICVRYITSAGNNLANKELVIEQHRIDQLRLDPSLIMGKSEYNRYLKDQYKEALDKKHHKYYDAVNSIIGYVNSNREKLVIKGSEEQLDKLVAQLFDRTVNSIKKIKTIDSEEWGIIGGYITHCKKQIINIMRDNQRIIEYYDSSNFLKIKDTCEVLMSSQREFNEYISEKVQSISKLFGTRVVRSETINEDEYAYIRPYKKAITPFTAEVSATVFASAENSPLEYVVKNFYPNKKLYPEQIRKLHVLLEELETLKEAKHIIDRYKVEYQQYLGDVPEFVMKYDEAGFYSRLGFANIDESVLTVEYKFAYTSGGGMAQRTFTVPMTEETIVELIKLLESKLTASAFAKEQRALMTRKLRDFIKNRDNFTCCTCGNSVYKEPNLLLEIDHIIPVAKGGPTEERNLQTLCWKCNRAKGSKIIS